MTSCSLLLLVQSGDGHHGEGEEEEGDKGLHDGYILEESDGSDGNSRV